MAFQPATTLDDLQRTVVRCLNCGWIGRASEAICEEDSAVTCRACPGVKVLRIVKLTPLFGPFDHGIDAQAYKNAIEDTMQWLRRFQAAHDHVRE